MMKKEDMIKEFEMALNELRHVNINNKYYKTNFSYANGKAEALAKMLDTSRYNAMSMYVIAKQEALRSLGFTTVKDLLEN